MTHWANRMPPPILAEMYKQYGTPHIQLEHVVDWLITQELDRQKKEKFTFDYNLDTLFTQIGDANESN
jgi:hypothetical protein